MKLWRRFVLILATGLLSLAGIGAEQQPAIQSLQLKCVDPTYIVAGDLNGDAHADIAVACHSCNSVAIVRNLGLEAKPCASFGNAVYWDLRDSPVALAIGRFIDKPNNSLFPYSSVFPGVVAVTQYLPGAGRISPLKKSSPFLDFTNGAIQLEALPFVTLTHLVLADFNNDGALDIALLDGLTPKIGVYFGKRNPIGPVIPSNGSLRGDPAFNIELPGDRAYFMATADFDRDGLSDIAVAVDGKVLIYVNTVKSFVKAASVVVGTKVTGLAVADFNRDGYSDIAAVDPEFGTLAIILNKGCGKFELFTRIKKDGAPTSIAVLDCNRDGLPDLAVAEREKNRVEIVLTELIGTTHIERSDPCLRSVGELADKVRFVKSHSITVGPEPISLAVADFDLNGMPDIAVALHGADGTTKGDSPPEVQVIYNPCCCQDCKGDIPCCLGEPKTQKEGGTKKA